MKKTIVRDTPEAAKPVFADPVHLSGGAPAEAIVEGKGWPISEERDFGGLIYRRIEKDNNPDSVDQAVYCGRA